MNKLSHLTEEWLDSIHINQIREFRCVNQNGDNHVQKFLQEQALDLMSQNLVRTRLFFDKNRSLIGFYSLFNDTIKLNKHKRKQLDIKLPHGVQDIPSIRLHFLGIDDKHMGKGYGNDLMASIITNCINVARISGCTLIVLEATEDVVQFYEKYDFIYVHPKEEYYIMVLNTKELIDV
ncbi:N-acetyltransferase [Pseudogracilibacillus sp. SO30301A]|uniref:N-acetyltransferase n=1 Tax=Pseudogracilibacillus sp. SO30301A TaxID=3098291 RepID=UPI00300DC3E1